MPIDPGQLRSRVTPQGETLVSDGEGGSTMTVAALSAPIWARVRPLRGREKLEAMQTDDSVSHEVTVRFPEIADRDAVESFLYDGRTLDVVEPAINVDERDEWLQFLCREAT